MWMCTVQSWALRAEKPSCVLIAHKTLQRKWCWLLIPIRMEAAAQSSPFRLIGKMLWPMYLSYL